MEFRQLKTFRAVAEQLNFTRAAEQLFLAQSSVSAQIRALEQELRVRLFDRIGKRVYLTDAGERLLGYARRIESMTEEIQTEVRDRSYRSGHLTIRVPETMANVYMPAVTSRYHLEYPDVRLTYMNCSDVQLREELNSGRIDLAFLMTDAIHLADVNIRLLKTEKLSFYAGGAHPLAGLDEVDVRQLAEQSVLLPKTD